MNQDTVKELEERVRNSLKEFTKETEQDLATRRRLLDNSTKNLIGLYSSSIRNLGIISGVVAPLSLTLLTVDRLNVDIGFLLIGFVLLIANIVLSQLFLDAELEIKDRKLGRAELDYVSATTSKWIVESEDKDLTERTIHTHEYVKSIDKVDELMGLKPYDIDLKKTGQKLKKHNKWVNYIFAIGCASIVTSTFYSYIASELTAFLK